MHSVARSIRNHRFSRDFAIAIAITMTTAAIALFIGGCAGIGGQPSGQLLRVGIAPNHRPIIFEIDGEAMGIEADFARRIGDALGRPIKFSRFPFDELLNALERGEVDVVMSGLSMTDERSENVLFTEPYMQIGQLALIRTQDIGRLGRRQLIRRPGARVGYERGTTGEEFVASSLTRAISFAFEDVDEAIRSLRAGRIDYFIHDSPTIWRLGGDPHARDLQGLYHPLTKEKLAWAVRQDNISLLAVLDTTLAHWKREGLIQSVIDRWIPVQIRVSGN